MPGSEVARKQHTLGGAAGLALLAFALAYRFFPDALHIQPLPEPLATTAGGQRAPARPVDLVGGDRSSGGDGADQCGRCRRDRALRWPRPCAWGRQWRPPRSSPQLLKKARAAEQNGDLFEPKSSSAITLYREALAAAPDNREAEAGLERIGGALRDWSLAAIVRGDEGSAQRYLAVYAELPHSAEDLANVRARVKTLHQVLPMLTRAADLMTAGRTTEPRGNNALEVYRAVLKLDPGNRLADAGLASIERVYLDRALADAAQDDFSAADTTLSQASVIRPGSTALLETRARIEGIRRQRAETVLAQARSALDSGNADSGRATGQARAVDQSRSGRPGPIQPAPAQCAPVCEPVAGAGLWRSVSRHQWFSAGGGGDSNRWIRHGLADR